MLAASARDRAQPAPQRRAPAPVVATIGPDAEEREWLDRLSRVRSPVSVGAGPVQAEPTPLEATPKSEIRTRASLPAPSPNAKRAVSSAPKGAAPAMKVVSKPKNERESSLALLSLSIASVAPNLDGKKTERAAVPPPPPSAPKRAQGFPKRLRHAADPTDYDVRVISAYIPPPVPGQQRVTPRTRSAVVPPAPISATRAAASRRHWIIALGGALAGAVLVLAVVFLRASGDEPARAPSIATAPSAAPSTSVDVATPAAEPSAAQATSTPAQPMSAVPALSPTMLAASPALIGTSNAEASHVREAKAHKRPHHKVSRKSSHAQKRRHRAHR